MDDSVHKFINSNNKTPVLEPYSGKLVDFMYFKRSVIILASSVFPSLISFLFSTLSLFGHLIHRFEEVISSYVEDERLSGKCPLPRHRMSEISFVLKAIATLIASLKKAPRTSVDPSVWKQLIALYPSLVKCTTSSSPQVCRSLRESLHEYADLLSPPS